MWDGNENDCDLWLQLVALEWILKLKLDSASNPFALSLLHFPSTRAFHPDLTLAEYKRLEKRERERVLCFSLEKRGWQWIDNSLPRPHWLISATDWFPQLKRWRDSEDAHGEADSSFKGAESAEKSSINGGPRHLFCRCCYCKVGDRFSV